MQAGQTYSRVLTLKHTFLGTKHPIFAFSDKQRRKRAHGEQQQTLLYEWRTLGCEIEKNVIFSDSAE